MRTAKEPSRPLVPAAPAVHLHLLIVAVGWLALSPVLPDAVRFLRVLGWASRHAVRGLRHPERHLDLRLDPLQAALVSPAVDLLLRRPGAQEAVEPSWPG